MFKILLRFEKGFSLENTRVHKSAVPDDARLNQNQYLEHQHEHHHNTTVNVNNKNGEIQQQQQQQQQLHFIFIFNQHQHHNRHQHRRHQQHKTHLNPLGRSPLLLGSNSTNFFSSKTLSITGFRISLRYGMATTFGQKRTQR